MTTRAINSGSLTFGLVTIPIKIYTSAKSETVNFNMLTKDGNPVKQVLTDKKTGEGVSRKETNKGFLVAKDSWVMFTPEEMDKLSPEKSKAIEIKQFIKADELHPMSIEKVFYLGPSVGGEKAYSLFSHVMEEKGVIAIAQWTNRTKDHLVAICPFKRDGVRGLVLQQLFYPDEIRSFADIGMANTTNVSEVEMNMAGQLIDSKLGKFNTDEYKDEFSERVSQAVEAKLAGKEVMSLPTAKTDVLDLMAALKASLEAAKKTG